MLELLQGQSRPPDHVLVVDNGRSGETRRVVSAFPAGWIAHHNTGDNLGPAGAAAYALDRLSRESYDWIYWGDDDNPPASPDTFDRLLKLAASADDKTGAVGAVGAMWDWATGEARRLPDDALAGVLSVDAIAGNSQLIIRRKTVADVGLPDSRLFFGFEEFEYCLRIRGAGYRLLVDGDMMKELRTRCGRLGRRARPRQIVPQHSYDTIWRRYYSTRNYIFAMKMTFGRPDLARREVFKAMARACMSWGHGPRYGTAFTTLQLRGIIDGYLGRTGRTVLPIPKYLDEDTTMTAA
jgi:glycosyltransferase involved in cell wall biosynthesis